MKRIVAVDHWAAASSRTSRGARNLRQDRQDPKGGDPRSDRQRIQVPTSAGFPAGLTCDVVETSAEHGLRILDCLPSSGCVLTDGRTWSWIVPTGSDIDVEWPASTRYLVDAAVLVRAYEPPPGCCVGHSRIHLPDQDAPYTHPILLYFAACCIAGVRPAMTVR